MADREQMVMNLLCGELQTPWSYCDQSCTSCKFYHEDSDMGARVSICVHGFGNSKESCDCYMTQHEYLEFVRSGLANLKADNAKLRDELAKWERLAAGIDLPEYPVTQFKPKDLERENTQLRELVRLMQICIEHASMCDFCPLFVSEDMDEPTCIAEIDSRMRALETEAD